MAQTRTAKGTNSSKADTTSLSVNNVTIDAGTTILVGIVFFVAAGNPTSVKWGNKILRRDKTNTDDAAVFRTQLYKARVKNTKTLDVVCTWGTSTPGARAMFVTQINEASAEHLSVVNDNNNSTTPNTSSAGTSTIANTLSIACFGMNGPVTDADASPGWTADLGHTLGQRSGTSGGGDTTNLTIQETYEILTATGVIRSRLTVTIARDWANLIVAYAAVDTFTITNTYHRPWKVFPGSDIVVFELEDSSNNRIDDIFLPTNAFEFMTDAQVTEYVTSQVQWKADVLEAENDKENADGTIETRLATFENDTVTV